jgi:SAM-dependent methyltransferase
VNVAKSLFFFAVVSLAILGLFYLWYRDSEHNPEIRHAKRPSDIAEQMLKLATVRRGDVIYDLECGDGTLAFAAAREYGAQTVCIDTHPRRISEVQTRVKDEHLENLITVRRQDWRALDLSPATVVVLFSPMQWDRSLRGHLTQQARRGTRIVAWLRNLGSWDPAKVVMFRGTQDRNQVPIMLWIADEKYRPQEFAEVPSPLIPAFRWP